LESHGVSLADVLGQNEENLFPAEQDLGKTGAVGKVAETLFERFRAVLNIPLVDGVLQVRLAILGLGVERLHVVEDVDFELRNPLRKCLELKKIHQKKLLTLSLEFYLHLIHLLSA